MPGLIYCKIAFEHITSSTLSGCFFPTFPTRLELQSSDSLKYSSEVKLTHSQRSCECPISEGVQDQVGQGLGQPDLGIPSHGRGLELGDLWGPSQPKPFCDSVILWSACSHMLW